MAVALFLSFAVTSFATEHLSLEGKWRFALGGPAPAFPQDKLPELHFEDAIMLPGTTETRQKGPENPAREQGMLTRIRKFDGPAWYQRDVTIPAAWAGQKIDLRLERTKYTQLWLDDIPMGERGLYTADQYYDLTSRLTPGAHRLTIMVDNRAERRPVQAEAHQFSDNTQTNWNGLLGRLELVARPPVWLDDVQIYPDVAGRRFRVRVRPAMLPNARAEGDITVRAESFNHAGAAHRAAPVTTSLATHRGLDEITLDLELGAGALLWDEFFPALYRVTVTLEGPAGHDERVIETGLRDFKARGTQFAINGRTTFLRGKHEGCVFPLTGHPPMDVAGWMEHLKICQQYGINHLRCHSWVPPEAAFAAADRLGIYLQPELPFWGTFDEKAREFLLPEAQAMLRAYGNHPSFVMLTLGNELGGDREMMNAMVTQLRTLDGRHLYADGSNNVLWDPRLQPTNDFWPTAKVKTPASGDRALPVRGSYYFMDGYDGLVQWGPADTRADFRASIEGIPVPVIGHEIGQYTVYPDYQEIPQYTGVTRARNLERFQASLARQGLADQAPDFLRASGALAASLYREDIELALRTPGFGGFQLLDLQDFPGQGTALVGMLNAFMQSKGIISAEAWRKFCSPIVPLARFDAYTWTTADTFKADVEVAHFGPGDLENPTVTWSLVSEEGAEIARGNFAPSRIAQGGLRSLGHIEAAFGKVAAPAKVVLSVKVTNASGQDVGVNDWPLWVYPKQADVTVPANVLVVRAFDAQAKQRLAEGRRVVLIPEGKNWGNTVPGAYATDFWCWPMFGSSPGTMGLLCDPEHPALKLFPTAFYAERQWSNLVHAATPVVLAGTPADFRPIVQVIDNLERNDKIGLVFEAKVGAGSLLVVACDLLALQDKPEARQLLASLLNYAGSKAFAPPKKLSVSQLDQFLRPSLATGRPVSVSSSFKPPWGFVPTPASAVDGDINTRWQAADDDREPKLTVDLGRDCAIEMIELLWEYDEPGYRYLLESSEEGANWQILSDQRTNDNSRGRHRLTFDQAVGRYLRVTLTGWPKDRRAALREMRVLGVPRGDRVAAD